MLTAYVCRNESFVPVERADLPGLLGDPHALLWVDLEAPTHDEAYILADVFHFHPLTIDDCHNHRLDPPKADDYGDYLFLIVQGIDFSEKAESVRTTELNLYIGRSYVVSFHHRRLAAVETTRERLLRAAPLPARGPDWLAHALIDTLVDQLLPVVEQMDEEIAGLEDEALDHPTPALVEQMTTLKRSILHLRRVIGPQRDVINRLSRGDFPAIIRPPTYMYYRDIYDHLVRMEDLVEGLRDLGDSVISTYLATVNNRMNEVMKALSIVGTIFLPLTLLASIFGTNFVPTYEGAGWWGFGAMCAAMLALTAAALWYFHYRRWL